MVASDPNCQPELDEKLVDGLGNRSAGMGNVSSVLDDRFGKVALERFPHGSQG